MNRSLSACFVAIFIGAITPAIAADEYPKSFKCSFERGNSWSYDAGEFTSVSPAKLAFEISAIDLEKQSATLVMDGKTSGKFSVIRALNANHYLEVAIEGFLNLTTVYDFDPRTKSHPAVHSRHFGLIGQPVFAQYIGFCTPIANP